MTADRSLPEGWRWVRFGDVVRQVKQTTKDPESDGLTRIVGLDHLDSESLPLQRWNEFDDLPDGTSFTRVFRAGQVLFGKRRAYQRKVAVADFDGVCSGDILVFEPSTDDLLAEFLPYLVQSDGFFVHALGTSAGSLSPRTKWQELATYEFAMPTMATQARMVAVLTSQQSLIDRYAEVEEAALAMAAALRLELLEHDFEGHVAPLRTLACIEMGRVYPSSDYSSEGVRLLRPGNIAPSGHVEWPDGATVHLPSSYSAERGSIELQAGDIVMNMTAQSLEDGFLGRVCIAGADDTALVNQRIARITATEGSTEYLFRVLQHPRFRRRVAAAAKGSKIKHLYWRDLETFEVPTPNATRAAEVTTLVGSAEQAARRTVAARQDSERMYKALSAELLAGDLDV